MTNYKVKNKVKLVYFNNNEIKSYEVELFPANFAF